MRALSGSTRTIWIIAATAVVSLGAGIGLSRMIVSPAEAAANASPPPAGPITVPVEQRALTNDIVMRGDATYEDPVSITLETGDIGGPAVVTGQVPTVGNDITAGQVILEVAGRPVILLTGELPVYRTLRAGVSGPDVQQLRQALAALGIDAGDVNNNVYDASAAAAVRELYNRVGYPAPSAGQEADAALRAAQDGVRAAEEQVAQAQRALNSVADPVLRVEADGRVTVAHTRLNVAKGALDACKAADPADPCPDETVAVAEAQAELNAATAARNAAYNPDTSDLRAGVAAAQRALADARTALAEAQQATVTPLPASEVVYLTTTPRRVDSVDVRRGSMVSGSPIMTVSGATLQIVGNLDKADADLIAEGTEVVITLPDGSEAPGTVQSVGPMREREQDEPGFGGGGGGSADPNRREVVVVPGELTEDQRWMLQGSNVRIKIPVSSTEGEVMAVPIAALSAGPGGESRVEVLDEGARETRLVTVETGLAAGGFVEIRPVDGDLKVGDLVVVGTAARQDTGSGAGSGSGDEDDVEDESTEDAEG
jgi:peptidoglycan hydrolase-like protein with peptidoglycan-binding domain